MSATHPTSATSALFSPAPSLEEFGAEIERLMALEAELFEQATDRANPLDDEASRLFAEHKATAERRARLEAGRDALDLRLKREDAARQEADRLTRAAELDAMRLDYLADGAALTADVREMGARLREHLARAESLVFAAGTNPETRNLLRARVISMVAFALKGVCSLPGPEAEPRCPFVRFADDFRADLARVGLALPTPTTTEEPSDHA